MTWRSPDARAKLESDVSEIKIAFKVPPEYPTPNFPLSWNVSPTDSLPIARYDAKSADRTIDLMRWGLDQLLGGGSGRSAEGRS
jgi:putative SOS response-associated peptidase YedK